MTWIFYGYGLVQFGLLGLGLVTFGYFWSLIGYVWVFLAIFETIKWLILGSWENLQYLIPWICRKYFFSHPTQWDDYYGKVSRVSKYCYILNLRDYWTVTFEKLFCVHDLIKGWHLTVKKYLKIGSFPNDPMVLYRSFCRPWSSEPKDVPIFPHADAFSSNSHFVTLILY